MCVVADLSRVPAHAASGVEHGPSAKGPWVEIAEILPEVRRPRRPPVAELRPLVGEAVLRAARQRIVGRRLEARNSVDDRYNVATGAAREARRFVPDRRREAAAAGGTAKESNQGEVQVKRSL
jgi:hypothetical protein